MSGHLEEIEFTGSGYAALAPSKVVRKECGLDPDTCGAWKDGFCVQDGNGAGSEKVTLLPGSKSRPIIGDRPISCGQPNRPEHPREDLTNFPLRLG